jgi:DNA-binding transcriptional ArsR family regulator
VQPLAAITSSDEDANATLDLVFAALADPIRRDILGRLDGAELSVVEIAGAYGISGQAVWKHVQVLVRAGLVHQARTGRITRCSLDAGPIFEAAVWINRYAKYWQQQFDTLAVWLAEQDEPADDSIKKGDATP